MKRVEATKRVLALIERVCEGGEFAEMVDEVYLFGSYARGALEVGDVDLSVSYTKTAEERERFREAVLGGWRDRELDFARALSGGARSLQIQFGNVDELRAHGFAPQLLWAACGGPGAARGDPGRAAGGHGRTRPRDRAARGFAGADRAAAARDAGAARLGRRPARQAGRPRRRQTGERAGARADRVDLGGAEPEAAGGARRRRLPGTGRTP